MAEDYERLRRLAEDLGDSSARQRFERERMRRVFVRTDAILHVIKQVENSVMAKAPERLETFQFETIRQHVRAGELSDASRIALRVSRVVSTDDGRFFSELRELVGVFGCGF